MPNKSEIMDMGGLDLKVRTLQVGVSRPETTGTEFSSTTTNLPGKLVGSIETLTGAGAVSVSTIVTVLVTTGADALTLANGTAGQIKVIGMKTDGGDGTLTPTTKTGFSTITFNDAGDGVVLLYTDDTKGWVVVGNNGATLA